ncbi:MAG TPA: DNA-directed RNA polymerase subunit omega [Acidobacteriaceae bacterium]
MRSELIFGALTHVNNRYQLCQLASKATRKLHKPNTRLQDTMNDVLVRFRESSPAAAAAPAMKQQHHVSAPQQRRAA